MVAILAVYSIYNVQKYFDQREHHGMLYTYGPELTIASEWLQDQPKDAPIYFFSNRWSINYETSRYLLRDHPNKFDRTPGFAKPGEEGVPDLDPEQRRHHRPHRLLHPAGGGQRDREVPGRRAARRPPDRR